MPDQCPICRQEIPTGADHCPACNSAATQPAAATVMAAAMLPVIGLVVFLLLATGVFLAMMKLFHVKHLNSPAAIAMPLLAPPPVNSPPLDTVPPMPPDPIADPTPSAIPAQPVALPPPTPETATAPPPLLNDFVPPVAAPGSKLVLRGEGLATVDRVQLVSSHGAARVDAKIVYARDDQIIITIPKVAFENDAIFLLVHSPGGVAIMVDQHTGNTPWGTDGHLHDTAVNVRPGDEIETHDNMIITAQEGSAISVGDNSLVLLDTDVTVKNHGKNCTIYYVAPVELSPGVSRAGMTQVPSVQVNTSMDAFRVKPAPPDADN
jgi:hypothetical protein